MKKILLTALLSMVAATSIKANRDMSCVVRQGFQVEGLVGFSLMSGIMKENTVDSSNGFAAVDVMDSPADYVEFAIDENATFPAGESLLGTFVNETLDYFSIKSFDSNYGIVAGMSLGYKGLFGCGHYSYGVKFSIAYEGAFASTVLTANGVNAVFSVSDYDDTDETYNLTADNVSSTYQRVERLDFRGGLTLKLIGSLGKELSFGNVSVEAGIVTKQLFFNFVSADPIESNDVGLSDGDTSIGTLSALTPGLTSYADSVNDDGVSVPNAYSSESYTRWAVGCHLGLNTQYYISETLAFGLNIFYDFYAPVTYTFEPFGVSSPTVQGATNADGEETAEQIMAEGKLKLQSNNFGVLLTMTYTLGQPSN